MTNEDVLKSLAYQQSPEGRAKAEAAWKADAPGRAEQERQERIRRLAAQQRWQDGLKLLSYQDLLDQVLSVNENYEDLEATVAELRTRKCQAIELV